MSKYLDLLILLDNITFSHSISKISSLCRYLLFVISRLIFPITILLFKIFFKEDSALKLFLFIIIVFFLTSCSNKITYSGKIINQENLKNINFKNKETLISKLGYPSYIDPIENRNHLLNVM